MEIHVIETFSPDWIAWINTNTAAGVKPDVIFGILLRHGFGYEAIRQEIGYTPNLPLDKLLNPYRAPHEFLQNYTNMGFEKLETASLIIPQQPLPLTGGEGGTAPTAGRAGGAATPAMPEGHIELPQAPDTQHWPEELKQAVRVMQTTQGATGLLQSRSSIGAASMRI